MVVAMAVGRISLRGSVGNSSSQLYFANGLAGVFPTLVIYSCYYSLMKPIQSFSPHISTHDILNQDSRVVS